MLAKSTAGQICFDAYRLHPTQGLWRDTQEVRVTPKSLALLRFLAERAGEVVTKQELFEAVWPGLVVSDAALTSCIQELRRALEDDARRPRYIETLHRRGYRFVGDCKPSPDRKPAMPAGPPLARARRIVGRDAQLHTLSAALERAFEGQRQLVFVTGEPGIGKTSLVRAFLTGLGSGEQLRFAQAECTDRFGASEAYQPLLDALMRLCAQRGSEPLVTVLRKFAPTWLAQLPGLQTESELATLQRQTAGATPTRMLRELNDALEEMARSSPIVVWIDDLHWSDASTLDWIAAFARRQPSARVLFIGTYRSDEATAASRQVSAVTHELHAHGLCHHLALQGLDDASVRAYVFDRFSPTDEIVFARFAELIRRRTEGNPLFMVNVLNDLITRGVLSESDGRWAANPSLASEMTRIPDDLRRVIENAVERLDPHQQRVLQVASVLGRECSAAAIAAGAEMDTGRVEALLQELARRHRFVRETTVSRWPDGTVAAGFEFLHSLYREVLRDGLSPTDRAELHARLGRRLEAAYGERASDIAAELAMHFDEAGDTRRAIVYLKRAAEIDRRRAAGESAQAHLSRALALLEHLPASTERDELELALRIDLGSALMATRGFGAREVAQCYERAHALCQQLTDAEHLFPVLWGLWLFYLGKGDTRPTGELAASLTGLASRMEDRSVRLQAHHAEWASAFSQGNLAACEHHARAGVALYELDEHAELASTYGDHDAGVCALCFIARSAALAGRGNTAASKAHEAIALARELSHPFSSTLALVFAAYTHQTRRDAASVHEHAQQAIVLGREHGFGLMLAWATVLEGWSLARLGSPEQGLSMMNEGLAAARATESLVFAPVLLGLLAEIQLELGLTSRARETLEEAFAVVERNDDRLWVSELHRLQGELAAKLADEHDSRTKAECEFRASIEIAAQQGANLLALRAAVSLGRLLIASGNRREAAELLTTRLNAIEEKESPDVNEANAVLNECAGVA